MTLISTLLAIVLFLPILLYTYLIKPWTDKLIAKLTFICFENKIVFNCAWEDPHVDKVALELEEDKDSILIITSAGCNVLSLALDSPKHIYSVDKNPCQNALLELKIAAIRELDYENFWELFGKGKLQSFSTLWYPRLRQHLSLEARKFWDKHAYYFDGKNMFGRNSFYYRGSSGFLAWAIIKVVFKCIPGLSQAFNDLIHAESMEAQRKIYFERIQKKLWNPVLMWLCSSNSALALLNGVPASQQKLLAEQAGVPSIVHFIKGALEEVILTLPMKDNYFYRVYLENGEYSKDACPDYLIESNFMKLKEGLVDRISIHTEFIEEFLSKHKEKDITRFILLDHMDWMAENPKALSAEWQQVLDHSNEEQTKYLWRSASLKPDFVANTAVTYKGKNVMVKDVLEWNDSLAQKLHKVDRVHTYTSFCVTDRKY